MFRVLLLALLTLSFVGTYAQQTTKPFTVYDLRAGLSQRGIEPAADQEANELREELKTKEGFEFLTFAASFGAVCGTVAVIAVLRRRLLPQTMRAKQAFVMIPMAVWTSACMLYQAQNDAAMRHPEAALFTALFYASPVLLLGGIGVWWFSPWRTQKRSDKIETLFQEA